MTWRARNPIAIGAALVVLATAAPLMNRTTSDAKGDDELIVLDSSATTWPLDASLDEIAQQASVPSSILALLDAQESSTPERTNPGPERPRASKREQLAAQGSAAPQHTHTHIHVVLTPELIEQCVQVAKDIDPALGQAMAQRREQNPRAFEQLLRQGGDGRRLLALAQLRQRDPELYQFKVGELTQKIQVRRAAHELRQALAESKSDGEIEVLRERLKTLVQFEMAMSLKTRGEYLCRLEERVKQLRDEIDQEARNFNATVEERIAAMLEGAGENDDSPEPEGAILPASSHQPAQPDR